MNDKTKGAEESGEGTDAPAEDKRIVRRKPIWVCVPVEFEEIAEEGEDGVLVAVKQPTKYAITRCEPRKQEVLTVLERYEIDITNIDTVIMFRADPMEFGVSHQINIRW
jgi:hypothetical protein